MYVGNHAVEYSMYIELGEYIWRWVKLGPVLVLTVPVDRKAEDVEDVVI